MLFQQKIIPIPDYFIYLIFLFISILETVLKEKSSENIPQKETNTIIASKLSVRIQLISVRILFLDKIF